MIPISLTLQGIYSYQEKQTIDFRPLTHARLFGIFGPVGSGKSTLLEAIIFALYGQTDRMNVKGDMMHYNMMNLKSNALLIDFVFEVDNHKFRSRVTSKRNSKRFEEIKTYTRSAYEWDQNEWKSVSNDYLKEKIGLDYVNFKRAVIIPQGKFQDFITLTSKNRSDMMKELFALERFELSEPTNALDEENKTNLDILEGQIRQLNPVNEEEIEKLRSHILQLEKNIKALDEDIKYKEQLNNELNELQQQINRIKKLEEEQTILHENEADMLQKKKTVTQYAYCVKKFKHLLESKETLKEKKAQLLVAMQASEKKIIKWNNEMAAIQLPLEKAKNTYANRELFLRQAEEAKSLLSILNYKNQLSHNASRLHKGRELIQEISGEITRMEADLLKEAHKKRMAGLEKPDIKILNNAREWFNEKSKLLKDIDKVTQQVEACQKKKNTLKKEQTIVTKSTLPDFKLLTENEEIKSALLHLEHTIDDLQQQVHGKKLQLKLFELAQGLTEGHPCPLCGSLSHPRVMQTAEVSDELRELEERVTNVKQQLAQGRKYLEEMQRLHSEIKANDSLLQNAEKELLVLKTALQPYHQHAHYQSRQAVDKAFEKYYQTEKIIEEAEKRKMILESTLEHQKKKRERYETEVHSIEKENAGAESVIENLTLKIADATFGRLSGLSAEALEEYKIAQESNYEKAAIKVEQLQQSYNNAQQNANTLNGILESYRQQMINYENEIKTISETFEALVSESEFANEPEILTILGMEPYIEGFQTEIIEFQNKQFYLLQELEAGKAKIQGKRYEEKLHQKLREEIQDIQQRYNALHREAGEKNAILKRQAEGLEQFEVLSRRLEIHRKRKENIAVMKQLFRGSGFVNHISTVHLQQLVDRANQRFLKLTRMQLKIELSESNDFLVRDFMNGGNVRSIKTLSGGQTFQAALSLALALSDSVHKRLTGSHHFFFLDEGFGSLDHEALDIVFKTLKMLHQEDRIVGIISHVEEMKQEIEMHLQIKNDLQRGSQIMPGWSTKEIGSS